MSDRKKFIPNSFQMPNAFVDEAMQELSGSAVKIYLVVVRKTRGWHKEADKISLSQFQLYTGIDRKTVSRAVSELVDAGLLNEVKGGHSTNEYALKDENLAGENSPCQDRGEIPLGEKIPCQDRGEIPLGQGKNSPSFRGKIPLVGRGKIPHTKDTLLKTKDTLLKTGEKDGFFEEEKADLSTLGCERQSESIKPDDRICAFSGLELMTFKKVLGLYPKATQSTVRKNAKTNGLDVLRYMQKLLEQTT